MKSGFIDDVYDTLCGFRNSMTGIEGVENLFEPGGECDTLYSGMLESYERLRDRLGVADEDQDVETIISSLMRIERIVSFRMFEYGARFGME